MDEQGFDAVLAWGRPFGDSGQARHHVRQDIERGLAAGAPEGRMLLAAVAPLDTEERWRVLADPLVRAALRGALPPQVLHTVAGTAPAAGPRVWGLRRGPDEHLPALAERTLCVPGPRERAALRDAARTLRTTLPRVWDGAVRHVRLVAVAAEPDGPYVPGAAFVERAALGDPATAAARLLDEALRQKLADVAEAHPLTVPRAARATVDAPWEPPGLCEAGHWDTARAVTALHGYVHLAVLHTLRGTDGRAAYERAHHLGDRLTTTARDGLTPAGRLLTARLGRVLAATGHPPPPPGAVLHLLLDRYVREAAGVAAGPLAHDSLLQPQLRAEMRAVRTVLAALGAWTELGELTAAQRHLPYAEARRRIAATLRRLAPDGRSLEPLAPGADRTLRLMVEHGSRELALLGALTPPRPRTPTHRPGARSG
ncbi:MULTISPECIES: hypothetical protein [Streptomyces]